MNDKTQSPFISIVIPARNAQRTLKDCLNSLEQLNYPKERMEILLVDGLSTDNTREIAALYDLTIVDNPKSRTERVSTVGLHTQKGNWSLMRMQIVLLTKTGSKTASSILRLIHKSPVSPDRFIFLRNRARLPKQLLSCSHSLRLWANRATKRRSKR